MITYYKHTDGRILPVEVIKQNGKWTCGINLHVFNQPEQPVLYEFENEKKSVVRMTPSEFTEEYSIDVGEGQVIMVGAPTVRVVASDDTREWDDTDAWATSDNLAEGWSAIGLKEAQEIAVASYKQRAALVKSVDKT